jgi:hypothetical protein
VPPEAAPGAFPAGREAGSGSGNVILKVRLGSVMLDVERALRPFSSIATTSPSTKFSGGSFSHTLATSKKRLVKSVPRRDQSVTADCRVAEA